MTDARYDIVIGGGGMTGAVTALALPRSLKVLVVEARDASAGPANADDRSITLAPSSRRLFEAIGLWPALAGGAHADIHDIHIGQTGRWPGSVHLRASALGVTALGHVFENRVLAHALDEALESRSATAVWRGAQVRGMALEDEGLRVTIEKSGKSHTVRTRLLIGSDGTDSQIRDLAGIGHDTHDYHEMAIVGCIEAPLPAHTAYERFSPDGLSALIPRATGTGVVLALAQAQAQATLAAGPRAVAALASARFGHRFGELGAIGEYTAFPLRRVDARALTGARVVLMGNAAHTIHPVAAQGLNLGLRDVAFLVDAIEGAADPGEASVLHRYSASRRADIRFTRFLTHRLITGFGRDGTGPALVRALAMGALDTLRPLKAALTTRTMGLNGPQPRLLQERL